MRSLLEKAIVHLLNGDDEKASALFHKFMVERARQIHESLRQDELAEDSLDENWDSEIKEEEYFDDDELGDDSADAPTMDGTDSPIAGGDMAGDGTDDAVASDDDDMGGDVDDMADPDGGDSEPGLEGKIDDLTDKIDQLTAEFDRVMSEFHDDDDGDGDMADGDIGMGSDDDSAMVDDSDGAADDDDLAGRMEDDMADDTDDDTQHFESAEKPWEDAKKWEKNKGKDSVAEDTVPGSDNDKDQDEESDPDVDEDDINESDDLKDITESVLAELDKIAPVGNTEYKPVGSSTPKNTITSASGKNSPLPKHNVMDRLHGEPVMTKGPTHKGYAREESPKIDPADNLVKNVRVGNRRKSYSDTMKTVGPKGDESALINKDFTPGGPKPTKSIVDGKTKKG